MKARLFTDGMWFFSIKRVRKFVALLGLILASCSAEQQQFNDHTNDKPRFPEKHVLAPSLPKALIETSVVETRTGLTPGHYRKTKKHSKSNSPIKSELTLNVNELSSWLINPFLGGVDPFLVGDDKGHQDDTTVSQTPCPGVGPEEPLISGAGQFGHQGICVARMIQIALKRIYSEYSTTVTVITSVAAFFEDELPGQVHEYINTNAKMRSGDGLLVRFRYDCVLSCNLDNPADRDYRYILTFSPLDDSEHVIGRAEWTVTGLGEVEGGITINRDMMAPTGTGLHQIQYGFSLDASGNAKSFTMKYPYINDDEFVQDATIVQLERRPETDSMPAMWIARGQARYALNLANNPAAPGYDHGNAYAVPSRIMFSVVAEDEFQGGRALYNAILLDDGMAPTYHSEAELPTNALTDMHIWATYKSMLEKRYTELYYEINRGGNPGVKLWFLGNEVATEAKLLSNDANHPDNPNNDWNNANEAAKSKLVLDVDTNSDGRWVVSGSADGAMLVIDHNVLTRDRKYFCYPHETSHFNGGNAIHSVAITNDGSRILSLGTDGYLRLTDTVSCDTLSSIYVGTEERCLEYDIWGLSRIKLNLNNNAEVFTVSPGPGLDQATIKRWSLQDNAFVELSHKTVTDMTIMEDSGTPNRCMGARGLDLSEDGRYVLASFHDATARVWDLQDNSEVILRHPGETWGEDFVSVDAVFSANSNLIFSGTSYNHATKSDGQYTGLFRWQPIEEPFAVRTVQSNPQIEIQNREFVRLDMSRDRSKLFLGERKVVEPRTLDYFQWADKWYAKNYDIYQVSDEGELTVFTYQKPIQRPFAANVFLPPYNEIAYWAGYRKLDAINMLEKAHRYTVEWVPYVYHPEWVEKTDMHDGRLVTASIDGSAGLWRIHIGALLAKFEGHGADPNDDRNSRVYSAQFVDQGRKVLTSGADYTARLWSAEGEDVGRQLRVFSGHQGGIRSAAANTGFNQIVTASDDGDLRVWHPDSNEPLYVLTDAHVGGVRSVIYFPDGRHFVSVGLDKTLKLWDATQSPAVVVDTHLHEFPLLQLAMSPDGKTIAVGDDNGTIELFAWHEGEGLSHLTTLVHRDGARIQNINFSVDDGGVRLVSNIHHYWNGNIDAAHRMKVWDVDVQSTSFGEQLFEITDSMINIQERLALFGGAFYDSGGNHNNQLLAAGYRGGKSGVNPSWYDFDALWDSMRNPELNLKAAGMWALPGEQVNPYYMEPITISSHNVCFLHEDVELTQCRDDCPCEKTCDEVPGGCTLYSPVSTFRMNNSSAEFVDVNDYAHLKTVLDELDPVFYFDTFSTVELLPID